MDVINVWALTYAFRVLVSVLKIKKIKTWLLFVELFACL
jgi:hypothetical protein